MSETKHTPGPWQINKEKYRLYENRNEFCVDYHVETAETERTAKHICKMSTWGNDEDSEMKANARLIAAAPAMWKACKLTCEKAEHETGCPRATDFQAECMCYLKTVQAAIALAEPENPG